MLIFTQRNARQLPTTLLTAVVSVMIICSVESRQQAEKTAALVSIGKIAAANRKKGATINVLLKYTS